MTKRVLLPLAIAALAAATAGGIVYARKIKKTQKQG